MAKNKKTPEDVVQENMDAAVAEVNGNANVDETIMCETQSEPNVAATVQTNGNGAPKVKEDKNLRFYRLATRRVPRAMKAIRTVRNLANKSQYGYTEAHAQRIIEALTEELSALKLAFSGQRESSELFSL